MPCSLLAIAPHLDDAALGCSSLLAAHPGARVATLFAGFPERGSISTDWDAACGFGSATQAVRRRREEDRSALAHFSAEPIWLDFCDGQYQQPASLEALRDAVLQLLERLQPERLAVPLGLFHSDHILAAQACVAAMRHRPDTTCWLGYEDGLYRHLPGAVQQRLSALVIEGIVATPMLAPPAQVRAKRMALRCYASQLQALDDAGLDWNAEVEAPECYWQLQALG